MSKIVGIFREVLNFKLKLEVNIESLYSSSHLGYIGVFVKDLL